MDRTRRRLQVPRSFADHSWIRVPTRLGRHYSGAAVVDSGARSLSRDLRMLYEK